MSKQRIETTKTPHIHLECHGDLQIRSWAESAVLLQGSDYQVTPSEKGEEKSLVDNLVIQSNDLVMTVPTAATIILSAVQGDAVVKNIVGGLNIIEAHGDVSLNNLGDTDISTVHGDLSGRNLSGMTTINEIMGDTSLRNLGEVTLNIIHGDCAIKNTEGAVQANNIMGDISLRNISGDINLEQTQRDVNLRNVGGLIKVAQVHGDIRLTGGLVPGKHNLKADGDIVLRWPDNAPLNLEASAPKIRNRINLTDVVEEEGHLTGRIGDGETFLILEAKGRIILKDVQPTKEWDDFDGSEFEFDFSGLGEKISSEIATKMQDLSTRMENNFGPEFAARMEEQAMKVAAKAEIAAAKAVQQVEKSAKKMRWQHDHTMWKPTTPSHPGNEQQATAEEQLKILKMVEKGIISPDEASTLLEAIEG